MTLWLIHYIYRNSFHKKIACGTSLSNSVYLKDDNLDKDKSFWRVAFLIYYNVYTILLYVWLITVPDFWEIQIQMEWVAKYGFWLPGHPFRSLNLIHSDNTQTKTDKECDDHSFSQSHCEGSVLLNSVSLLFQTLCFVLRWALGPPSKLTWPDCPKTRGGGELKKSQSWICWSSTFL